MNAIISRRLVAPILLIGCLFVLPGASGVGDRPVEAGKSAVAVPDGLTGSDWDSIRQVYERNRHAVVAVDGEFRARNPGQQWLTHFDGCGFVVQPAIAGVEPDAAGWRWGLALQSYGFPGHERTVSGQAKMTAHNDRVTYDWDPGLLEWFVNDRSGLEHGFTLVSRPPSAGDARLGTGDPKLGEGQWLELRLAVRGGLHAQGQADGRGVSFVNEQGSAVVNYTGLKVWDADRRVLAARIGADAAGLRLTVDVRGARYPVTIDPIAQQAYLKASNTDGVDFFGHSVAISGDTVVVGAPLEDSNTTGVNGSQADNSAGDSGAAYVFVRDGVGVWSQQAYLKASNTDIGDVFGFPVAVSGDTVVVGASSEASNATGVNGNQVDDSAPFAGAAYVFVRDADGVWSQQAYLKASNTDADQAFGSSVAVSGDTVVVGAYQEASNATGVNGNQADNSAFAAGAAYVFFRDAGGVWSQQAYLKASNTDAVDLFGWSVAVSGDTVVVGAWGEDSNATGVNGNQADNSAVDSGAAYVFFRDAVGVWSQQAYLKASNTDVDDEFGLSVAVSGDTVAVGAWFEDSNAAGVNGNQADNSAGESGAAYVFVRDAGGVWSQQACLKASNTSGGDQFGISVAVSGGTVAVGAQGEDSSATGVDSDQADNFSANAGAAYVFVRDGGGVWGQQAFLKASNAGAFDQFGISVAVSGDTVVVGALGEDSNATGVNGNEADNSAGESGAAYVFFIAPPNVCGNGVVEGAEQCDDVNLADGDGCSSACTIEPGFVCTGEPSVCALINHPPTVGDDVCVGGSNDGGSCSTDADCLGGVCGLKSRYITITPPVVVAARSTGLATHRQDAGATQQGSVPQSIQVTIVSMPLDPARVGEIWWAGASQSVNNAPNPALTGARVLCEAAPSNAEVWPTGNLHLFGEPIVPGASYEVRMCDTAGANCSDPLLVATGQWGDVVSPFGGTSQPNFSDINAVVAKFQSSASAPDTPRPDLVGPGSPGAPNVPNQDTNFADINADVNAFQGGGYPFSVPACP